MGHNGLQRLFGRGGDSSDSLSSLLSNTAQSGGGVGGVSENGAKGILRLLNTQLGGQGSWFIPLAVVGTLAAAWGYAPDDCASGGRSSAPPGPGHCAVAAPRWSSGEPGSSRWPPSSAARGSSTATT